MQSTPKGRVVRRGGRRVTTARDANAALRRDPELEDVLRDLEARLQAIAHVRTREYDDKLAVVEALAAPYALAFLHEIRRLDAMVFQQKKRIGARNSGAAKKRKNG